MANQAPWIAQDLIAWRKEMGWTQSKAAEELGVTLRGYQKREAGQSPITRETMLACGALRQMAMAAAEKEKDNAPASS